MRSATTILGELHDIAQHLHGDLRAEVLRARDVLKAALDSGRLPEIRSAMLAGERVLEIVQSALGESVA